MIKAGIVLWLMLTTPPGWTLHIDFGGTLEECKNFVLTFNPKIVESGCFRKFDAPPFINREE